jgi:predicted GIY-YIG superfamily endonuclease
MKYLKEYHESLKYHRWTKDECGKEALKYQNRNEFVKNNRKAYRASERYGWLDEICSHMVSPYILKINYWTKEKCTEEALKYSGRKEFQLNSKVAYNKAIKNGWLDEICSHMKTAGNKYKRCIYAIEFSDNKAYIGLTYNINKRFYKHLNEPNSSVFKYKKMTGIVPIIRQLIDYIDVDDASKLENVKKEEYIKNGWDILNINVEGLVEIL